MCRHLATRAQRVRPGHPHPYALWQGAGGSNGLVDPRLAADRGYAVVVQDVRGRGGSDGEFEPYITEADDGYDSVEWVADQQWCDGRVVMAGMSYVGITHWLATSAAPPSLAAIAPALSSDTPGRGLVVP